MSHFNQEKTSKHFITSVGSKAVNLIRHGSIAMCKELYMKRHFSTKRANYVTNLSLQKEEGKLFQLNYQAESLQNS